MLFMMALPVSSNFNCFWRGSMFKDFFRGEGLEERTKTRLYFRALFVHCDAGHKRLARKKILRTGLLTTFLIIIFFLWLLSAQGQCILEKVS